MPFVFRALPAGEPDAGSQIVHRTVADQAGAFPCRRCLRDAQDGDRLLLLRYDPFERASPYTGDGPIYVHADGCPPHRPDTVVPTQLRSRLLAVRAYDVDAMLLDCDVVDGGAVERVLERVLGDPRAAFAHVHFARPGCFACRVDRAA